MPWATLAPLEIQPNAIVRDLIDNDEKEPSQYFRGIKPIDKIFGLTIKDIEEALSTISSWEVWKYNLKIVYNKKYQYSTTYNQRLEMHDNIDLLFDYYEKYYE